MVPADQRGERRVIAAAECLDDSAIAAGAVKFVQIMELTSDKFDEIEALHEKWKGATEGQRTTKVEWMMRDRDEPTRYVIAVQFDSYDDAMRTRAAGDRRDRSGINDLTSTPTVFRNLDLIRVDEG